MRTVSYRYGIYSHYKFPLCCYFKGNSGLLCANTKNLANISVVGLLFCSVYKIVQHSNTYLPINIGTHATIYEICLFTTLEHI